MITSNATDNGTSLGSRIKSHLVPFLFLLCLCGCTFWSQAHAAIIRLINSGTKRDEARLLLAEYCFRTGNRTGAEQELQAYLALYPDSVEAQANLQRVRKGIETRQ